MAGDAALDPSVNPNADPAARRERMKALTDDLLDVLQRHSETILAVAEDVPIFFRSLFVCFIHAMLSIQWAGEEDKSMPLRAYLGRQFVFARAAFTSFAAAQKRLMDEPLELERKG